MHWPNLSHLSDFSTLQLVCGHTPLSLPRLPLSPMPSGEMPKSLKLFSFSFLKIFIVETLSDIPISTPLSLPASTQLPPPLPSGHHHTLVCVCGLCMYVCSSAHPFTFFHQNPCPHESFNHQYSPTFLWVSNSRFRELLSQEQAGHHLCSWGGVSSAISPCFFRAHLYL